MRSVKLSFANKIFKDFQGPYKLCRSEAVSPRLENTCFSPTLQVKWTNLNKISKSATQLAQARQPNPAKASSYRLQLLGLSEATELLNNLINTYILVK